MNWGTYYHFRFYHFDDVSAIIFLITNYRNEISKRKLNNFVLKEIISFRKSFFSRDIKCLHLKVCEWVRRIFVLFCFRDKLVAMMLIKFYVTGFWKLKTISTFFQLTQSESIANVSWSAMVTTKVQFDTVSAVLIC